MAELALGLLGIADGGGRWFQNIKTYRDADPILNDMILRIEVCWSQNCLYLEVCKELESSMNTDEKDLQRRLFASLRVKLEAAVRKFAKLQQPGRLAMVGKLKLAFVKDVLENTISELESWQRLCEPSWFYWVKRSPPAVDTQLNSLVRADSIDTSGSAHLKEVARNFRRAFTEPTEASQSVFIREDALDGYTAVPIPFCLATVVSRPGQSQRLIVDVVDLVHNTPIQGKNVRDFARRLRQSEPFITGLPSCKGVVRHADKSHLSFLFRVPEGYSDPASLRQLLVSGRSHDSLSDRLEMAKQLAKAVYYVHLYGFVHKSIRPETILSIGKADEPKVPSSVLLVGFQVIRTADGRTYSMNDMRWENNLYRHPKRQGDVVDYFVMQHDIYSLGVCLLEMGLWELFVVCDGADGAARPSPALALADDRRELRDPAVLKDHLVGLSRSTRLRSKMGDKYSKVVEMCLTCLDEDNVDFGDEQALQDEDGIEVGERYIEKILSMLNGLSA